MDKIKRGRRKLTPEQAEARKEQKKEYFKEYYANHKSKYENKQYNYKNAKLYKLYSPDTPIIYIGSTCGTLEDRLAKHLLAMGSNVKSSTYALMNKLSKDWKIATLVSYPCEGRTQLEDLETIYICHYQDKCLNKAKKYDMETIREYLDGRYPEEVLPEGVKNEVGKKL